MKEVGRYNDIHPSARIAETARVCGWCYIGPGATIGENAVVGNFCEINSGATVGDGTLLNAYCLLNSDTVVGRGCIFGAGVLTADEKYMTARTFVAKRRNFSEEAARQRPSRALGGDVVTFEVGGGVHARGDGNAKVLCEYITEKAELAGMQCEEAARHLHVLASDVAEHVDSVGERDKYGFDLVVFAAAGGAKVLERDKDRRGRIDVSFRMEGQAGPSAAHGGGIP